MPSQKNRGQWREGVSGNPRGRPPKRTRQVDAAFVDWQRLDLIRLDERAPSSREPRQTERERFRRERLEERPTCEICDAPFGDAKDQNGPCVDHCHRTGKVRGVICQGCNKALGFIKDRPETAERMAAYLRGHDDAVS
jgi:hypothetical protein